jgi:hypothetical protein
MKERLTLEPIADDPEVGRWLAALEDGRRDTLRELESVGSQMVDWYPDAPLNSIGSLLYHIALIEADWVATEILELTDYPAELAVFFPWPDREPDKHLSRIDVDDRSFLKRSCARPAAPDTLSVSRLSRRWAS